MAFFYYTLNLKLIWMIHIQWLHKKKNEISRCYEFDADSIEKMNVIIHAYDIVFMRMKWATSHYAHVTLLSEAHTNGDELQRASLTNLKLYLDSVW